MKNRNLVRSFINAANGVWYAIRKERNMKIHIAALIVVLIFSIRYRVGGGDLLILFLTVSIVFICELINTSIELIMDIILDHYHPKAKIVKDLAAGSVLVASLLSLTVAWHIFFERAIKDLKRVLSVMKEKPYISGIFVTAALFIPAVMLLLIKRYGKGNNTNTNKNNG